jgi:photoactive yellow protein
MVPDFQTPNLAAAIEALSPEEIDRLPFGVVGLDADGSIRVFNQTEARLSGYRNRPAHGRLFFIDVAPCMNNGYFKGRIDKALKAGTLDISFSFVGDFNDCDRELFVRAQSASDGGCWIFIHRAAASAAA